MIENYNFTLFQQLQEKLESNYDFRLMIKQQFQAQQSLNCKKVAQYFKQFIYMYVLEKSNIKVE